jgi:membrane-associated protein
MDALALIETFGSFAIVGVALFILLETGVVVFSFLPGDSLLFALGLALATRNQVWDVVIATPVLIVSAVLGSFIGYRIGAAVGPRMFANPKARILKPQLLERGHAYFEKHGIRAIFLSRFVPVLRAVVPVVLGITKYDQKRYLRVNFWAAVAWIGLMFNAGYLLGNIPWVKQNIEICILVVIVVTSLPMPIELLREWLNKRRENLEKPVS